MRLPVFPALALLAALFLTGCAYEGVIVRKESRPHPLYLSIGVEGMYSFVLRDRGGAVYRQMVTPEVFEQYAEGEYFNDLQPSTRYDKSDGKTMRTMSAPPPPPFYIPPRTVMSAKKTKRQVASNSQTTSKMVVRRAGASVSQGITHQPRRPSNPASDLTVATTAMAKRSTPAARIVSSNATSVGPRAAVAPTLPMMERSAPDEREIVYIPTRVR